MTNDNTRSGKRSVNVGGSMTGAINTGDHGTAHHEVNSTAPVQDQRYRELLEQIQHLRRELPMFAGSQGVAEVDAELVKAEEEIADTGAVTPGLLSRLWQRLEQVSTSLGGLASALTLTETVRKLTG